MRINIAKSSGFCFGVRRAIEMCLALAGGKTPVYVLGDIVHNDHVVNELAKKGIKRISAIKGRGKGMLVISAHGAPRSVFTKAAKSGYKVVDATCPRVKDIYRITRELEKKGPILIIGDKGHSEVRGIAGQLVRRPVIIESANFPLKKLSGLKKCAVVTQSTQSTENIKKVMGSIRKIIPGARLHNTLCSVTISKQGEVKKLARKNDVVLIVGSKTSANTKRLFQAARNVNKKTRLINSEKDIKTSYLRNFRSVGIMAGASTPDEIVRRIVDKLRTF